MAKNHADVQRVATLERRLTGGRYITGSLASRLADMLIGTAPARAAHERVSMEELRVAPLLAQSQHGHIVPRCICRSRPSLFQ